MVGEVTKSMLANRHGFGAVYIFGKYKTNSGLVGLDLFYVK